jgi:predicted GIY-YIG superfamily endonuclease
MCFVYILESASTKRWEIGSTADLLGRLSDYNEDPNSSKGLGPWSYIFVRPFESEKEARQFERYLNRNRGKLHVLKEFSVYFRFGVCPDTVGAD